MIVNRPEQRSARSALGQRVDERRLQKRFRVRLPVKLGSATGTATGTTRDISASGIYFETSRACRLGERIRFSFVFEHVYPSGALLAQCEGQVVRIDSLDEHVGVAALLLSYQIRRIAAKVRGKRLNLCKRTGERRGRVLSKPGTRNESP